jgi:hypothetical protein
VVATGNVSSATPCTLLQNAVTWERAVEKRDESLTVAGCDANMVLRETHEEEL